MGAVTAIVGTLLDTVNAVSDVSDATTLPPLIRSTLIRPFHATGPGALQTQLLVVEAKPPAHPGTDTNVLPPLGKKRTAKVKPAGTFVALHRMEYGEVVYNFSPPFGVITVTEAGRLEKLAVTVRGAFIVSVVGLSLPTKSPLQLLKE